MRENILDVIYFSINSRVVREKTQVDAAPPLQFEVNVIFNTILQNVDKL